MYFKHGQLVKIKEKKKQLSEAKLTQMKPASFAKWLPWPPFPLREPQPSPRPQAKGGVRVSQAFLLGGSEDPRPRPAWSPRAAGSRRALRVLSQARTVLSKHGCSAVWLSLGCARWSRPPPQLSQALGDSGRGGSRGQPAGVGGCWESRISGALRI